MPDVMTPEQRHKAMARNHGRTRPERTLAKALWALGFRYLTGDGYKKRTGFALPGNPDLVFARRRLVVFVDGCFWHGCPVCRGIPQGSGDFWKKKIEGNVERDKRVTEALREQGWTVLRVPEHDLKTKTRLVGTASRVAKFLTSREEATSGEEMRS